MLLLSNCSSESSDWENARTRNDVQTYEQFIEDYPLSVYKDSANFKIKEIINPTGVVISVPVSFSLSEAISGKVDQFNFTGNTITVKLSNGNEIEALATKEEMEEALKGKSIVTLKRSRDNQWEVLKLEGSKTKSDTIK